MQEKSSFKDAGKWIPKTELVRDVTNGVCHQCYENSLEQQKSDTNVHTANENLEEQLPHNQILLINISTRVITPISVFAK